MAIWQVAALAEAPLPGSPPQAPASSAPSQTPSVLLLTNGRVVQGLLSEDGPNYVLRQKLGIIKFPKREVEKIFGSLEAVYQYKLSRLAQDDPDEHMKLAKWCLPLKMFDAARAELQMVRELSPDSGEARAMLASLDATAERAARPTFDPELRQTKAEEGTLDRQSPAELSPSLIKKGRASTLAPPVIFDLPPALSVRRAQEFATHVHKQLQVQCANCHNERSNIPFQLIQARTQRDYADEMIVRANLEATLQLVNPENLQKSPLLTNSLLPHKPNNQPILASPKSIAYQTFATWVNSLKAPSTQAGSTQSASGATGGGSGFATDRTPAPPTRNTPYTPTASPPGTLPATVPQTATRLLNGQKIPDGYTLSSGSAQGPTLTRVAPGSVIQEYGGSASAPYVPDDTTFPVPYPVSGASMPQNSRGTTPTGPGAVRGMNPAALAAGAGANVGAGVGDPVQPPREVPYAQGTFQPAPGLPPLPVSMPKPGDAPASKDAAKKNKPSTIDPALLEKFYSNRKSQ